MMKKKLLTIALFYLLILVERLSSVISLVAFICSMICYFYDFDFRIVLFQVMTGMLAMCCWKAASMDEQRLDDSIENVTEKLGIIAAENEREEDQK